MVEYLAIPSLKVVVFLIGQPWEHYLHPTLTLWTESQITGQLFLVDPTNSIWDSRKEVCYNETLLCYDDGIFYKVEEFIFLTLLGIRKMLNGDTLYIPSKLVLVVSMQTIEQEKRLIQNACIYEILQVKQLTQEAMPAKKEI